MRALGDLEWVGRVARDQAPVGHPDSSHRAVPAKEGARGLHGLHRERVLIIWREARGPRP